MGQQIRSFFAIVVALCLYKTVQLVSTGDAVSVRGARPCCPVDVEYSWCALAEDLRSILSFALGILVCSFMESRTATAGNHSSAGGLDPDKTKLYAFVM